VFTSKVKRMSCSDASRMVLPWTTPALLIRMVGWPTVWRSWAAAWERALREVMSHLK
jgi:hypothetical protein